MAIRQDFVAKFCGKTKISVLSVSLPILTDVRTSWDPALLRIFPVLLSSEVFVFAVGSRCWCRGESRKLVRVADSSS
jgi:hypothetical protein